MKAALFFLLIGAILGAVGWRAYQRVQNPTIGQRVENLADHAREAARETKDVVADKAKDNGKIKEELARTGQVVRSEARIMGDRIGDARIITVIKGKYVLDEKLSALAITVDCRDGVVTLTGSATSEESINRAVALALETNGVHNVTSQLAVKN